MTDFVLNAVGTSNNPWKTSTEGDRGTVATVGSHFYDLYQKQQRPPLPRVPTGQFAARIPKTVKHYLDPIKIAWELSNPRVPLPNVLRHGAGSITERNI